MSIETRPEEALRVKVRNQAYASLPVEEYAYPVGDPRLRAIDRGRIPARVKYEPIASVVDAAGKDYGDAAGLVELPGGGRILYIAGVLLADPANGPALLEAGLRFLAKAGKR